MPKHSSKTDPSARRGAIRTTRYSAPAAKKLKYGRLYTRDASRPGPAIAKQRRWASATPKMKK